MDEMTFSEWIEGLTLTARWFPNLDFVVSHDGGGDAVHLSLVPEPFMWSGTKDRSQLKELGWTVDMDGQWRYPLPPKP